MTMGLFRRVSPFILLLVAVSGQADPASVSKDEKLTVGTERVFRPARHLVGNIRVELDFANGHARGQVMSPVPGEFVWRDRRVSIQPGIPCVIGP